MHLPWLSPSFCLHKHLYDCTMSKIRKVIFLFFQTSSLNWFTAQLWTHVLAKGKQKCFFWCEATLKLFNYYLTCRMSLSRLAFIHSSFPLKLLRAPIIKINKSWFPNLTWQKFLSFTLYSYLSTGAKALLHPWYDVAIQIQDTIWTIVPISNTFSYVSME